MAKIQQFKNKPSPNSFGQYYYDNNDMNNFQPLEESDSVMKPVDKFSDKTLHSNVVTNYTRDFIVDKKLRYSGVSGIKINNIEITENNTGPNPHIDNYFSGYICDRNTFDCFDNNGVIRSYRTLFQYFREETEYYEGLRDFENTQTPPPISSNRRFQFFKYQPGQIGDKGAPDMSFLNDRFIVEGITVNADDPIEAYPGDYQDSENIELRRGLSWFRNTINEMSLADAIK